MNLRISGWAIGNPIPVSVLFLVLIIWGIIGYRSLPIKLYPDTSFPVVMVSVTLPGAAATEVETQITRPVEAAIINVSGVKHVTSTATLGFSTTTIEFEIGENPQRATDAVRTAIDRIRIQLPAGIEPPIVERFEFDSLPVVTYSVAAPTMSDVDLSWFIDDTVARKLVATSGVGQVKRVGGVQHEINVTLDPVRLQALGLTAPAVNNALRTYNVDAPGGRAEVGQREQTVRVLSAAQTVESLNDLIIPTADGRRIQLRDVATVSSGPGERRGFALLDGQPVAGFQVMKTKSASDVAVERNVAKAISELAAANPAVQFKLIVSTAKNTANTFQATEHTLIEGMLLAAIVVFFFLRDWRATLISAAAMPISLIPTFAAMHLLDFSLNVISLLGLTLVIGILVDDAIVEVENIQKRVQMGQTPWQAAFDGADAIGLAVVATTATIVVVFLPVSFMGGVAGQFFKEFGLTVAIAVLFSLLVARLLTPLMAAYLMLPSKHPASEEAFKGRYRRSLEFALDHRWLSLLAGFLLFVGSLGLAALLPTGFTPANDNGIVSLSIQGAPGATFEDMQRSTGELTTVLRQQRDVQLVSANVGSNSSSGDLRAGTITVVLKNPRSMTTQQFQSHIRPLLLRIPDVRLGFTGESASGGSTVQILLSGENGEQLDRAALQLEREMRGLSFLLNVHQVTPRPGSELVIRLKPDEAARLGVTADSVASIARVATMGDVDANVAKFNAGAQRLPVRVRLSDVARENMSVLRELRVPTSDGGFVPLSAVAEVSFQEGAAQIDRFDRARRATVEGELNGVSLGQAMKAIDKLPVLAKLPNGVKRAQYGESENMAELFGSFIGAMLAGIGMIYGVLVLLFRSFFKPATILAALPLSLAGAFLALLIANSQLNLPVLIGLLMLMGLAAKNSILLVEHAIESERAGMSQHDALIEACRERARPIVMTTVAMAAGMLPTALGLGEGSEFRQPMAVAVIGGLISSTVLSLVLVPVVYEVVDDIEMWLRPRLARLVTSSRQQRA